jgi:hydroxymethylglutaryl-CoA synthase
MGTQNTKRVEMNGILAYGAYIPRLRLQRSVVVAANAWFNSALKSLGKGERAMANWDEDSITMAVESARDCLRGLDRGVISSVVLASTSAPNADRQNAGIVKEALNLRDATGSMDAAGGQRAGTSALIQALQSTAGSSRSVLWVASEKRRSRAGSENELLNGDAASALLIGVGDPIARFVGSYSVTVDFVDHFRVTDADFDYGWESRWVRDEGYNKILAASLKEGLRSLEIAAAKVDHLIVAVPVKGVPEGIAKMVGIRPEAVRDVLGSAVGYTGVAHPGLMLAHTLESAKPGELIVVSGFGQGCDVLVFEVTQAVGPMAQERRVSHWLARRKAESNYVKFLSFNGLLEMDKGMRAEADFKQPLSALYRSRKTVLGLVGGRSRETGAVQFPRSEISVDTNDHAVGGQEDYPLADKHARILSHTADNLCYTPDPPAYYGMIEFEGGGRMFAEFADVDPELIEVGRELSMMFRIKDTDTRRGFTKYFWKAVPLAKP